MSHTLVEIRPGSYADSVSLLQVSRDVAATPGVEAAQVAMATPLNLDVLTEMGFRVDAAVTSSDLVVALRLTDPDEQTRALAAVDSALAALRTRPSSGHGEEAAPRSTRSALAKGGELALVSVPGEHAFVEAMDALDADRDVMLFSDNVPLAQEVALKRTARERGTLVMGPDCGTAVVGGVGLGFANVVAPGPVGLVAASGTGCQQLLCLLDAAGVGVSAALGVGGRDLSADVGGISTVTALHRLDQDPAVELIVLVSKPPADDVAAEVRRIADRLTTPVEFALLGEDAPDLTRTAERVLTRLDRPTPDWPRWGSPTPPVGGRFLRGLFVGGTLCEEASLIARAELGDARSGPPPALTEPGHVLVDFGADDLTRGRPHPMIDPTLRLEHLSRVARDPETAVVLLDLVLGHGAEPDPAAELAPAIRAARAERALPVVACCVGTAADPQGLARQAAVLAEAGAEVYLSNAEAARRAAGYAR